VLVAEPWDRQNQIDDDDDDDQVLQQPGSYACPAHTRRTDPVSSSLPPSLRTCTSPDTFRRQGRLNQWAHWARAQSPRIFFSF